jgi:hypothetical protein
MIGVAVKECKSAKIKTLSRLINSTQEDEYRRLSFNNINFSQVNFFVQNGIKKKSRLGNKYYELVEQISKEKNIPILVRELPVIRQICLEQTGKQTELDNRWIRFSWNSFFMDEGLHPYDPSYDRWSELQKRYNIEIHNWKSRGDYILFCLQLDGDSALNRLTYNNINYKKYCSDIIQKIKEITDRPILLRAHPYDHLTLMHIQKIYKDTIKYSDSPNLYDDLNFAYCMVTYNSTSCVESVLYGIPTIVLDPSAVATPVANKLEDIESLKEFDRQDWLNRIAFMQWQGKEMADGYLWDLLKQTAKL